MTSIREGFALLRAALEHAEVRFAVGGSWASTAFGEPRFTNAVDVLAGLTPDNLDRFLDGLPPTFHIDREDALAAIRRGRPFNAIFMPLAFKFDFFSASAFPIGAEELDRAIMLADTGLSEAPTPFVTPEDILLAKLNWFKSGGEVSEVQWRDILGIIRARGAKLDRTYLEKNAEQLGLHGLLAGALDGAAESR